MRLKKILPYLKGCNNTKYELWVIDEHRIVDMSEKYYKYYVDEFFKKQEAGDVIFISVSKNKK